MKKQNNILSVFGRQIENIDFNFRKKNNTVNLNDHPDNTLFFNQIDVDIH